MTPHEKANLRLLISVHTKLIIAWTEVVTEARDAAAIEDDLEAARLQPEIDRTYQATLASERKLNDFIDNLK